MKNLKKRGQLGLSFKTIFSVFLLLIFLGFAVYTIMNFLETKSEMEIGKFLSDLQSDVDIFWKTEQGSDQFSYTLPIDIKEVCFVNKNANGVGRMASIYQELTRYLEEENMMFYPVDSSQIMKSIEIKHIDLVSITKEENPLCFQNENGEVTMNIKQEYGGTPLVFIGK